MSYIYNLADTWNAGATTFTAIKMDVTDTASAAGSLLMDLQKGGISQFKVSKNGVVTTSAGTLEPSSQTTWTPVITFTTPGDLSVAYSIQLGSYIKIGKLVVAHFELVLSSFTHTTASGNLLITGLPFASADDGLTRVGGGIQWAGITKAGYTDMVLRLLPNVSQMELFASTSGNISSLVTAADMPTGGLVRLRGTMIYPTA